MKAEFLQNFKVGDAPLPKEVKKRQLPRRLRVKVYSCCRGLPAQAKRKLSPKLQHNCVGAERKF